MKAALPSSARLSIDRHSLADGKSTTIHIVSFDRASFRPRLAVFDEPTRLLDWCTENHVANAVNGGFFGTQKNAFANGKPLGELWLGGRQLSESASKFDRACLVIDPLHGIEIAPRSVFADKISGDLLEAGPLLIGNSKIVLRNNPEGFSTESLMFDGDLTVGRAPRTAIGYNNDSVWLVVAEGRSDDDAGLTLSELAEYLLGIGATDAMNLDGGSACSLIINQELVNQPRTGADHNFATFPRGRKIANALILPP